MAYLAGTWDKKWWCPRVKGNTCDLYVDSDHAGEKKLYSQSRTGVAFFLNGFPTHWKSKKQPSTSLSSAAAEIYALSEACKDARLRYWISEDMGYCCKVRLSKAKDSPRPDRAKAKADTSRYE